MAASWPAALNPTLLRNGFQAAAPGELLRSEMERGHKHRRVSTGTPRPISGGFRFKPSQFDNFENFVLNTLQGGVLDFEFPHPDDPATLHFTRFVPQNGQPYQYNRTSGGDYLVTVQLEIFGSV